MSFLLQIVYRNECRSTHHKFVVDALRELQGDAADAWRGLFLRHYELLFQGAKDPDDAFRDFRNHVLHPGEGMWGGAPAAARRWRHRLVEALRQGRWANAAYAFGVFSHYFTDVLQPLHTAQSEAEAPVHRAVEWSAYCCYDELATIARDELGLPRPELPQGENWLQQLMEDGARRASRHYRPLVENYDLAAGVRRPQAGLSQDLKERLAEMVGLCISGLARILERSIAEAGATPPRGSYGWFALLTGLTAPFAWTANWDLQRRELAALRAIEREWTKTGAVRRRLPLEQRIIAELRAAEAAGNAAPAAEESAPRPGEAVPAESPRRTRVRTDDPVVRAPSIGGKTARRLERAEVRTIGDLLRADAESLSRRLNVAYITPALIRQWQQQATLVCRIPALRGQEAQLLVQCGVRDLEQLAGQDASELWRRLRQAAETDEGRRLLGDVAPPELSEVGEWVRRARVEPASAGV